MSRAQMGIYSDYIIMNAQTQGASMLNILAENQSSVNSNGLRKEQVKPSSGNRKRAQMMNNLMKAVANRRKKIN